MAVANNHPTVEFSTSPVTDLGTLPHNPNNTLLPLATKAVLADTEHPQTPNLALMQRCLVGSMVITVHRISRPEVIPTMGSSISLRDHLQIRDMVVLREAMVDRRDGGNLIMDMNRK
jgi:hypothetical protein